MKHAEITHRLVSSCTQGRKLAFCYQNGISLVIYWWLNFRPFFLFVSNDYVP